MRWYLYAIATGRPVGLPAGLGGRTVFVKPHRGFGLIASEWESAPPPALEEAAVMAHEAVVEAAMREAPLLPLRFGTVVDEPVCLSFVDRHAEQVRDRLTLVAGRVEVSLKVLDPVGAHTGPRGEAPESGAAYLLQRQRNARMEQERMEYARELVTEIEAILAPWVTDRHHRLLPAAHVLASLTHLIAKPSLDSWVRAVSAVRTRFPGLDFLASGPWPPYHFSEVANGSGSTSEPNSGPACER